MSFWTDYPITEFGDEPGKPAPMRECIILAQADSKRLRVRVIPDDDPLWRVGVVKEIKALKGGYIYCQPVAAPPYLTLNWGDFPEDDD